MPAVARAPRACFVTRVRPAAQVFGGYASSSWKPPTDHFYGTGESFLWASKAAEPEAAPEFVTFKWTREADQCAPARAWPSPPARVRKTAEPISACDQCVTPTPRCV